MELHTTICALATPPGEGGIATVRVSGPDAYAIVSKIFAPVRQGKSVADAKGYTAMLGHYLLHGAEMDECVALFFRAPHSYTGEDVIELSVHGGTAMADGLQEALITAGCVPAGPGEFTRRALENGRMSLTQAEAVMEVIAANGRQGAALAKSALDGRLAKRIGKIQTVLQTLNAHLTAWVDYPEEDVPELSDEAFVRTLTAQKGELDALINGYSAGAVLRHGVDCVLLGRPNVGKSTLLNLLAGFDRAIVTPVAGTTRDIVEQAVQLGSVRLNLFDTAGVREVGADGDAIEAEGIRRSWKKLDEAGLVLAVFDAAQPLSDDDLELARRCKGRPAIAVLNKQDLAGEQDVPHGTFWTYTTCSFPLRRANYIVPAEKPISYEHDLALPHIHPHPHRENVWKYPLFLVRPFVRRHLVFLPRQTHIVYDAHIRSQNNNFLFYNHNFANGDFCAGIKSHNP